MYIRRTPFRSAAILSIVALLVAACGDDEDVVDPPAIDEDEEPVDPEDEVDRDPEPPALDAVGDEAWTTLAEAPLEVTEVAAAAFQGELWTAGGLTADGGVSAAVQVYDPSSDAWREGPELPEPVHHASLVATASDLVLIGGYRTLAFDPVADVFVLDQENDTWVEATPLPEPRGAGAGAWDGARVVYGGGIGEDGLADEVWGIEGPDNAEWTAVANLSTARDHLAATSDGEGTVWFLAGREVSLESTVAIVDQLRGDDAVHIGDLPTPRGGVAGFFSEDHGACLAGGEEPESTFAEVECIATDGTTAALPDLSLPRHGLGAAVIDGIAYVALGGPEPGLAVSGSLEALRV
jgi:hypothetical protein